MIYYNPRMTTDILFPRTLAAGAGAIDCALVLVSTATRQEVTLARAVTPEGDYLVLPDFAPDMPLASGEWEYSLRAVSDGAVLASGIMRVGVLPAVTTIQYEKPIEYEQYEAE